MKLKFYPQCDDRKNCIKLAGFPRQRRNNFFVCIWGYRPALLCVVAAKEFEGVFCASYFEVVFSCFRLGRRSTDLRNSHDGMFGR